jgi:1-acyl-sn-glycerol-3-phosphate acyltransferase
MRKILTVLRSIYAWTGISILVLIMIPVIAIVRLFDRDPVRYRTGYVFRKMGSWVTKVNPMWKIELTGEEVIKNPRNPYVVVSNHQSMADIPCVSYVPWEMKWVGKTAVFKVPLAGLLLKMAGDIPVNRSDKESRGAVYDKARAVLDQNCSVMFFAEGTRSKDTRVLPFHDGAFKVAIDAQVPIIPIAIEGSHDCLPKNTWLFTEHTHVQVKVLPPVETTGMTQQDLPALRYLVRNTIMDQVALWRGVSRLEVDSLIPTPSWPEPWRWSKRYGEAVTALTELQQKISETMAYLPKRANETSDSLSLLTERLALAVKHMPDQAVENIEELYERVAAARAALAEWQHRTEEKVAEMPRQLAEAIEELSASLRNFEPASQPA